MRALIAVLLSGFILGAGPAQAQSTPAAEPSLWCRVAGETIWSVARPAQNAVAEVTLELGCRQGDLISVRVKADTRCGRALCTWNWAEMTAVDGTALVAVFQTFSATRTMRLNLDGESLSVIVENAYNQPDRASDGMRAILSRD
ncbi:MAG: hypothetical protein KI785_08760 [Devosiaceae bacterium]|nr:hypothetical protein [Devosiaceae bacterium MH13]